MTQITSRLRLLLTLLLLFGAGAVFLIPAFAQTGERGDLLRVVFFDVGQGDAIFIESPTGAQVLIDAGADAGILRHLGDELGFFDRTLDVIVATHPDLDHIGGFLDVLERYKIETVVMTENEGTSAAAETFTMLVQKEGADVALARRGMSLDLGGGAVLEVLFPDRDPRLLESNTASIIARLTYGETEFLLTGDAPQSIEEYLVLIDSEKLQSDVLKAGHHGSNTSTSEQFLRIVDPDIAIISAGKDNRYGHPHAEVINLLSEYDVATKNTAEDGSIVFESDGVNIELK